MKSRKLNPNDLVVTSFETATSSLQVDGTNDPTPATFCRICPEETQTCYFCPEPDQY